MTRSARSLATSALAVSLSYTGCAVPDLADGYWQPVATGTTANLRGLHVVDHLTVWASGSGGTLIRTLDGGATFAVTRVPGESAGELRDVHAFDAQRAVLIACQPARIYRTEDGGKTFARVYDTRDPRAFLDAIAFFDARRGLAFGDALGERFQLLRTTDGGASWRQVPDAGLPVARAGEGGFAASGTCLTANADGQAWIGTGIGGARGLPLARLRRIVVGGAGALGVRQIVWRVRRGVPEERPRIGRRWRLSATLGGGGQRRRVDERRCRLARG